jgi:hypothetical protein
MVDYYPTDSKFNEPHKKRWIIYTIMIVVFILLLFLAIYFLKGFSQESKTLSDPACEKLDVAKNKAECYFQTAVQKQDTGYCNQLSDEPYATKDMCYDYVYTEKAKAQKDPSICDKIEQKKVGSRDFCFQGVALIKKDPTICEQIKNRSFTDIGKGEESSYDKCYEDIALEKDDSLLCDKIIGDNQRNYCYSAIGTKTANPAICGKIKGDYSEFYSIGCYTLVAAARNDTTYCDKLSVDQSKWQCYTRVAAAKRDIRICDKLPDGEIVAKKDYVPPGAGSSRSISTTSAEGCYNEVISASKDVSLCQYIISDYIRNDCATWIS